MWRSQVNTEQQQVQSAYTRWKLLTLQDDLSLSSLISAWWMRWKDMTYDIQRSLQMDGNVSGFPLKRHSKRMKSFINGKKILEINFHSHTFARFYFCTRWASLRSFRNMKFALDSPSSSYFSSYDFNFSLHIFLFLFGRFLACLSAMFFLEQDEAASKQAKTEKRSKMKIVSKISN